MGDEVELDDDDPTFPDEPDEDETYPGIDPDGKERHPLFAGRFAAADTSMSTTGVTDLREPSKYPNGAIAASPFRRS